MKTQLDFEKSLWDKSIDFIAGVDEVGRGALAGPMVVAAVILKKADLSRVHSILINNDVSSQKNRESKEGKYLRIKDSKVLSPKVRGELSKFIIENCVSFATFQVSALEIDTLGISRCTQKAFQGAIKALKTAPEHILTDAFPIREYPAQIQTNIKRGDKLSLTISAASIVAKVFRDNLMTELGTGEDYACYNFGKHKGYGTAEHLSRLREHGLSNQHRKSFIHL